MQRSPLSQKAVVIIPREVGPPMRRNRHARVQLAVNAGCESDSSGWNRGCRSLSGSMRKALELLLYAWAPGTFSPRHGPDGFYGHGDNGMRHHARGRHLGWRNHRGGKKVVIIKKRGHHDR
jgi:hypothetical protein